MNGRILCAACFVAAGCLGASAAWVQGTGFRVESTQGRPALVAPDGKPFQAMGVVWDYGPERGPLSGEITVARLTNQLAEIEKLGFNTLCLYGGQLIPEMLDWCDRHELAVSFRAAYLPQAIPAEAADGSPALTDPAYRAQVKAAYDGFLEQIRNHPSVLSVAMDLRPAFPLNWSGAERVDRPGLAPRDVAGFAAWLERRYPDLDALNRAWDSGYAAFGEVLEDTNLVLNGMFRPLTDHPARVDVYRYAQWVEEDYLHDLVAHLHSRIPGLLVTIATEHPECVPDVNPGPGAAIAFLSPAHCNSAADAGRDPLSLGKLVYESRWHYDLHGGPVFIAETGWRTKTLDQSPPNTTYAWIEPPDEEAVARAYARQFALLKALPWIGGCGYFKLYDKGGEGDFGYLRDTAEKKPMARVGDAMNAAFPAKGMQASDPICWIYYPQYARASHRPGFQQFNSLALILGKPFFQALEERLANHWDGLRAGDPAVGQVFVEETASDFSNLWRGFAFTETLPQDDRPVLLFSTVSEMLSTNDRAALMARKTIGFGAVGVRDEFMRPFKPWHLEALGIRPAMVAEQYLQLDIAKGTLVRIRVPPGTTGSAGLPWSLIPPEQLGLPVECSGQVLTIPRGRYNRLELLAALPQAATGAMGAIEYASGIREEYALISRPGTTTGTTSIQLDPSQNARSLILPTIPGARLLGAVLMGGGVARDVAVTLRGTEGEVAGKTPWLQLVPAYYGFPAGDRKIKILQRFANGDAAVIAKGRHVAFLYDPLTWTGHPEEISREIELHERMLNEVFDHLDAQTP